MLTIDQFEELATLCRDDTERERFLRLLANAVQSQPDAFRLIVTLRTDFEPQFTQKDAPLAAIWGAGRYVVPPMDIEDLRQVIEGPASVRVLYFDPPELVDDLIKEVIQTPGALPLLSFTLSELYVKYVRSGRDDRALAGADYQALGGVVGSLRKRASEEYDALPDDAHRATMQRMVAVEGGELARRRVALSELEYPTAEENARVQAVFDRLVDARLLVRGTADHPDGTRGEAYIEPAHDALVLAWDKLLRWKQEAEEYLPLQRRLTQATGEWSKAAPEAKSGLLWDDDPRLPQVEETLWPTGGKQKGLAGRIRWVKQVLAPQTDAPADTKWLNGAELVFVRTSVSRRASTSRRIIGITAAVMIALAGLASFAFYQPNQAILKKAEAEREARRSEAGEVTAQAQRELATKTDTSGSLALILAREAVLTTWTTDHAVTVNADATLRAAVDAAPPYNMTLPRHRHRSGVSSAKYSPNGRFIVTASADQTARIWDVTTGQEVRQLRGHTEGVNWAAYSPDGSQIVTASADGTARIWDATTGQEVGQLRGHTHSVYSAAYSPDGSQIVTASGDGTARIWNARTGKQVRILRSHTDSVSSAAYSPDGQFVVTAHYQGTAIIWGAESGEPVRSLGGHTPGLYDWVLSATYSPDGQYIVTAYDTPSEARIWDATTGQELSQLRRHAAAVNEAVYSPDGQFIVTASDDTTARVWNASTGEEMRTPGTNAERINSVAYSPDGQFIVTANADGTARIWNTRTSTEMRTPGDLVPEITSAAYSPDGRFIITARVDGTARIWDTITSETVHTLDARTDSVHSVAYSPNGKQIVTVGCSRKDDETGLCREASARLWDASTGLEVGQFTGRISEYSSATFSPDGKFVVTKDNDLNTVSFWHVPTTQKLYSLMVGKFLAYSPDSMHIVTADGAGTFYILDARTGAFVHEMSGHTATISSAAYSPNGRQIVTTSQDGTVRIWDSRRGQEVRRPNGHVDSVWSAIYSPDGKQIVTSGCDNRSTLGRCTAANIRIWDVATGREIRQLPGGTFGVGAYSPDGQFVITKGDDGMVRVWIADIDDLLAEAARLIQRDPPLLTPEERRQYGLEMQR